MSAVQRLNRALIVNHCGMLWPSAMVRALQFKPLFANSSSWRAEYTSRRSEFLERGFHDQLRFQWRLFFKAFNRPLRTYSKYWHRRREDEIVAQASDFDIVYLIKSPHGLPFYQRLARLPKPRIVIDINDAVWQPYYGWHELDATLELVHGVICENDYVAEYARKHNPNVFVVPDAPQVEVFDNFRGEVRRDPTKIVLGWIGGAENIAPIFRILEPLEALFARYPQLELRLVGVDRSRVSALQNVRLSCRPKYNQKEMIREILSFDIGLFPLFHNVDGLARGTLKAEIYMSGEAVAVCEDYGENSKLIRNGINGMLAVSQNDWYEKLEWLITHPSERVAIGQRGLETIRQRFTAELVFAQLVNAFERVLVKR
jgi:glycosyltransferase involved in cell wall biosynthesis